MPDAKAEQVEWVSRRMGIEDAELVRLLVDEMGAEDDPWEGARRVWEAVG